MGFDSTTETQVQACGQRAVEPVAATTRAYCQIAGEYARKWFKDPVMEPLLDRFCEQMDPGDEVLDAGCGPGRDVESLAKRGFVSSGVDISPGMISEARERLPHHVFRTMDFRSTPFLEGSFAGVWCNAAIHHLPRVDALAALSEFNRILNVGGVLAVTVLEGRGADFDIHGRYRLRWTQPELRDALNVAGFSSIALTTAECTDQRKDCQPRRCWLQAIASKGSPGDTADESRCIQPCFLCETSRFSVNRKLGIPGAGSVLWSDEHLYIAPDVAPAVDHHLLIVERSHSLCFGLASEECQVRLGQAKEQVKRVYRSVLGAGALFFEHGSMRSGQGGACVAHSHLHCVPSTESLCKRLRSMLRVSESQKPSSARVTAQRARPYLYLEDDAGISITTPSAIPSQFFRQCLASSGRTTPWRWQTASRLDSTQQQFRAILNRLGESFWAEHGGYDIAWQQRGPRNGAAQKDTA